MRARALSRLVGEYNFGTYLPNARQTRLGGCGRQETAAAQQVADAHGIPFLGICGMSDGPGDPLNLPGYPFSFFVYKQLAADNAAIVTETFLRNWAGP